MRVRLTKKHIKIPAATYFHDAYLGKGSQSVRLLVLCTNWTYYRTAIASIYKLAWIIL